MHLNYVIFVDDKLVEGYYPGMFIIKDSLNNVSDTIKFNYEVGDLIVSSSGYEKLMVLKSDAKIKFVLNYRNTCPYEDLVFSTEETKYWLIERYVIMRVYNYKNKHNQKIFREKSGYGIEINIPGGGMILPRKKSKKWW